MLESQIVVSGTMTPIICSPLLTGIVGISTHAQRPREARVVVELLVGIIEEAFGGNVDRSKSHIVQASTYEVFSTLPGVN